MTEVHHVNGLGENAGVVYAEMQARENQSGDLMALKLVSIWVSTTDATQLTSLFRACLGCSV